MSRPLRIGQIVPPVKVTAEAWPMAVFSLIMADPNPMHFDRDYVQAQGQGDRLLGQGTLSVAYPLNALIAWLAELEAADDADDADDALGLAAARIGRFGCRFTGSVWEGDHLTASGEVTAIDDAGQATIELWLEREGGERVLSGSAVVAPSGRRREA